MRKTRVQNKQEFEVAFQEVVADTTNDYDCLSENARVVASWMIDNNIDLDDGEMYADGESVKFTIEDYYNFFNNK